MEKSIAFFDFDGTITTKDTMLELAKFAAGSQRYYTGMLLLSPWLVAMKAKLISKKQAKEKLLAHFFGGQAIQDFNRTCAAFSTRVVPGLIRSTAMKQINNYRAQNIPVIVVSASAENWVAPWCTLHGLQYLCTQLQVQDGIVTGKLSGENCNGNEKVCRINAAFNLADFKNIYCYGDTAGDKLMLGLATEKFYRHFTH